VDKHQRICERNPNKNETLTLNDEHDENQFLSHFNTNEVNASVTSLKEEVKKVSSKDVSKPEVPGLKLESVHHTNLSDEEEESEDEEEDKQENEELDAPRIGGNKNESKLLMDEDECMILPHLHKHDLFKKTVYDKPSFWI